MARLHTHWFRLSFYVAAFFLYLVVFSGCTAETLVPVFVGLYTAGFHVFVFNPMVMIYLQVVCL